jgi:hypothetical protein
MERVTAITECGGHPIGYFRHPFDGEIADHRFVG